MSAANGGVDDSEKRPLADADRRVLRLISIFQGGRLRRDKLGEVTEELLEDLIARGLLKADEPRQMLVDLEGGGRGVGQMVVYRITKAGRSALRRSNEEIGR